MTTTTKESLIVPEIMADAVAGQLAGVTVLFGSPAVIVNGSLPQANRGGDVVTIPFFGTLGELDDVATDGDSLTPAELTMTDETASVTHSGKAFEITEWAKMASAFADPYMEAARQIRDGVVRRMEAGCVTAAAATTLSLDVYSATVPLSLNYDVMVAALAKFNDEQAGMALLSVHSKVYGDLRKLRDSTGRPLLTDPMNGELPKFMGVPVVVSDRNTKTGDTPPKYTSLLMKRGAILAWFNGTPEVQTFKDVLKDATVAAIHVYHVQYLYKRLPGSSLPGAVKIITN